MTLPMSLEEKKESIVKIMSDIDKIEMMVRVARMHLQLVKQGDYESDHLIMAKNMVMEVHDDALVVDHRLHEVIDAPVEEGGAMA